MTLTYCPELNIFRLRAPEILIERALTKEAMREFFERAKTPEYFPAIDYAEKNPNCEIEL